MDLGLRSVWGDLARRYGCETQKRPYSLAWHGWHGSGTLQKCENACKH